MDQDERRSRIEELRPPPSERSGRPSGSMLSIFLAGGVGLMALAVLFFLFAPLGGVVLGVVGVVFLLAAIGMLHYVIWGWWLGGVIRAEVAAEEEAEAQRQSEADRDAKSVDPLAPNP